MKLSQEGKVRNLAQIPFANLDNDAVFYIRNVGIGKRLD